MAVVEEVIDGPAADCLADDVVPQRVALHNLAAGVLFFQHLGEAGGIAGVDEVAGRADRAAIFLLGLADADTVAVLCHTMSYLSIDDPSAHSTGSQLNLTSDSM